MQTLTTFYKTEQFTQVNNQFTLPKMRRQTHMYCTICNNVAETYNQKECNHCGSISKWSIPWKNEHSEHPNEKLQVRLSNSQQPLFLGTS
jgi:hypothetical protein